ncbi:MAG TPA: hypothetical protein VKZ18_22560 [Polyangia bacterium]|nr:hypothetical protein [Polyangia bacterium]
MDLRRLASACALAGLCAAGCRQTVVLDDLGPDAGLSGSGGKGKGGSFGNGGSTGTGGKGGSGPTDASVDGHCSGGQTQPLSYQWDTPQMVVVLDRSTTMNAPFGSSTELEASLNAIYSLVSSYGGDHGTRQAIKFAFLDFPDTSMSCSGTNASNGCCSSDPTTVFTDFDNANLSCSGGGSSGCLQSMNRPTAAALNGAVGYFNSLSGSAQHNNERYVVLVSDNDPQKGPCQGGDPCNDAENAKNNLAGVSATLEVVAIDGSNTTSTNCLTNLGATNQVPSPYYYPVSDANNSLPSAFQQIGQAVAQNACRLTLPSPPTTGHLTVQFGCLNQQQDSGTMGNGWNWDGDTRVFLHGTLCGEFLQSSPNSTCGLQVYDGCGPDHFATQPAP